MDDFPSFAFQLRTTAAQNLAPSRIKAYLEIIFKERGLEASHEVMEYVLLVLGKHLQMMVAYNIFKEDQSDLQDRVMKLFAVFNKDYAALLLVFQHVTDSTLMPGQLVERLGSENILFREMSFEMKKRRDVAFKKYDLDIKNLKKYTEEKKITQICRWVEQVQKSWARFQEAETEFCDKIENEGKVEESTQRQEALWELESEKDEAIEKANRIRDEAVAAKNEAIALSTKTRAKDNAGDALTQKLSTIRVNRKDYEHFQVTVHCSD